MRILVEAMSAEFGGIRTYVENLLDQWNRDYPDDELHVLMADGATLQTGQHRRHAVSVRRPANVGRPLAQTRAMRQLATTVDADAVLATLPSTTLRHPGRPFAIVVHDLRHELRPEQFTRWRRAIRRISYGRGYRLADGIIAISHRSLDDLHELHPYTRLTPSTVAYHGADHVEAWPLADRTGPSVTFAHQNNKNVPLILDGWQELLRGGDPVPPLLVIGVPAAERDALAADLRDRGLAAVVQLAALLPDEEFRRVMAEAEMVIFPTDFEGFGLPVVEGMYLGKPVVIGPERATMEVSGGHAFVMRDWTAQALGDAVLAARASSSEDRAAAQEHAKEFTWAHTVEATRAMLTELTNGRPR